MDNIIRKEIIRRKSNSTVSRVWTESKTFLINEDFGKNHQERLNHEYFISSSIDLKCVLKPLSFEPRGDSSILIYEDIDGELLNNTDIVDSLNVKEKLILSLKISDVLKALHSVGIIHNHLCLDIIIYNQITKKIRITDLTGSRIFLDEHEASENLKMFESVNPLYISPEQTGKVKLPIDYRTDLYSAGVIFYRIFKGRFPFEDGDIKRHIEEKPDLKSDGRNSISHVIAKLLEKKPDERYQSAEALKRDIIDCIRKRELIEAGSRDIKFKPDYESIVSTRASAKILKSLRSDNRVVFYLNGKSGSGKSYEVRKLTSKLKQEREIFLKIENCEITQTIPYLPLIKSLQSYIPEISEEFSCLPDEITALIYDSSNNKISGNFDKNGLIYHFIKMIEKIFRKGKVVIIVEDCQFLDNASIEVIDAVIKYDKFKDLFVLFTSEKEELNEIGLDSDCYKNSVLECENKENFTVKETIEFLSKSLFCKRDRVNELALYFHEITNGDPSYNAILTDYLFKKELIFYNRHRGNFIWNLNRIKSSKIPDTFEKLIFEVLDEFSEEFKGFIYSASVYGYRFSSGNLKEILNQKNTDFSNAGNLFIPLKSKFFNYRFRTRKIALLLEKTITEDFLNITRKSFARVILKELSHGDLFKIFAAVFFLNKAKKLIIKDNEVLSHAELNLYCGMNLNNIFRYRESFFHLKECCFKIDEISESDKGLVKKICLNMIKTSYMAREFSCMETYSDLMKSLDKDYVLDINNLAEKSGMRDEKKNVLRVGKFVLPEKKLNINDLSNEIVIKALKKFKGNKSKAAGYLGISRQALYRRLEKINKIS